MPLVKSSDDIIEVPANPRPDFAVAHSPNDLASSDPHIRQLAIREAAHAGAAGLLVQQLKVETDAMMREMILTSLVRIGGIDAARPLLDLLRSEEPQLRNAVIETLAAMGDAIIPEIERLLDDTDSDVRIFAVNVLQSLQSPRVPEIALKVITNDPHVNVCAAAVDILAEVGQPEMAPALRDVLKRFPGQRFLAFAVRIALERIG